MHPSYIAPRATTQKNYGEPSYAGFWISQPDFQGGSPQKSSPNFPLSFLSFYPYSEAMNSWWMLIIAILLELCGTTCLKLSHGFTRLAPSAGVLFFYLGSFYLMSLTLKTLEVGIVYAIWSGVGTALIAIVGVLAFGESVTLIKILGLLMIIGGTFLLRMTSTS